MKRAARGPLLGRAEFRTVGTCRCGQPRQDLGGKMRPENPHANGYFMPYSCGHALHTKGD